MSNNQQPNITKNEITIDLNKKDEIFLDDSSNLQINAFEKVKNIIDNILNYKSSGNKEDYFGDFQHQQRNNTIYIQGSRGAGKTTFLKYVIQYYHHKNHKVKPIAFIDPTTISTQQHILTEIIAKLNQIFFPIEQQSYYHDEFTEKWNKQLSEISKGMELLSFKNAKNNSYNSSWFFEKALNNSISGQQLEYKLHKLINLAIEQLNKDALLIAIDDIDTQTDKAYELLETIRCYLTHPKLIVLISGDLELYSHIVCEHKYNEIIINSHKNYITEKHNIKELVNQLEQQYLIKVLPVPQRIHLEKLIEIEPNYTITVKDNNNIPQELKKLISDKLSNKLGVSKKFIGKYTDFILSQPIRTIIQLLIIFLEKNNKLENQLRNIYIRDLMENNININLIESDNITPIKLGYEIIKLLNYHNDLETGFYCRPDSEKESYNSSKLFLSSLASEALLKNNDNNINLGNALNIILTTCAPASIYLNFVKNKLSGNNTIEDYINYIELGRGDRALSLVEHFSPICLNSSNKQKMIVSGILRTSRRKGKKFDDVKFSEGINNLKPISTRDRLQKEIDSIEKDKLFDYVAGISVLLSSSSNIASNGETRDYTSIYTFMAAIAELLMECNDIENQDKLKEKISNILSIRTYSFPSFIQPSDRGDDDDFEDEENNDNLLAQEDNYNKLYEMICKWLSSISKYDVKISLLMLGKIWTRIFYSINNISNDISKETYLGEVFARFIWGICNSILIEEVRYNNNKTDDEKLDKELVNNLIKAKNVSTSIRELKSNLSNVIKLLDKDDSFKEKLPLSYSILSCPLSLPFLINKNAFNKLEKGEIFEIKSIVDNLHDINNNDRKNELNELLISRLPIVGLFMKSDSKQ